MKDEKTLADKVHETFMDCLYKDEELPRDGSTPPDAVLVEGIVSKFGFHPGRLEKHREDVRGFLNEMPDEFQKSKGGGWTFLNLCVTKSGEHWAEHPTIEKLLTMGIGLKMASYSLPRDMWDVMPGGVPYVMFDTGVANG